jgi:DNA/RNA endonuclease YhcR with UshA esterase domain
MRLATLLLVVVLPNLSSAQSSIAPLNPAAAAKRVDQKVTVQMDVKSTGGNSNRYLNSTSDYKDPGTFTIYIPEAAVTKFKQALNADPTTYYKGKTVLITGTVTLYKDKPQITVDEPAQIKVIPRPQ